MDGYGIDDFFFWICACFNMADGRFVTFMTVVHSSFEAKNGFPKKHGATGQLLKSSFSSGAGIS